ncbi:efflux RND transporter permease subunit [Thiolapillus brandeum]|uniref:Cu(I)/Ag(I) efflux system membrane protein CusA n=1 Tax=Thiolapillus brandeum TaxID=1076588 RepID=A0A7U6GK09_9GAMM|nr:efflux RND transporter permease subunit [Thiolapillus brandeum]BAO45075.1 Cu(I)/Ag(I) efflux system membrane protein CusA [Thiolapillus brandeum]
MIPAIIDWSLRNRFMVLLLTVIVTGWGLYSVKNTPLDAIPDLSEVQVIIKTSFPGQAPQVVEDQVTYPLATAMLSVPKAINVRGYSFFGDSYIYVIFEDGTDPYWARSRVLEYLSQAASKLPPQAKPELGPDATGVGWVFEYALVDRTNKLDLAQLRSLQDWYLKFELQTVPGVSEVATIGGMVKQYQVVVDPDSLRAYGLNLSQIRKAIQRGNQESGGSVIEMGEAEYMIRATGYIDSIEDLREIPLGMSDMGVPITLKDVAQVRLGPQMRRGIAELDGEGEVVGGVIIMRFGENALSVIANTKKKLEELSRGLPEGVEIIPTYDRSDLIHRAVETLNGKLLEEFLVVALVCAVFLFHLRSALVVILSLPVGILVAFIIMERMGINANIMSLGGIAIAIGAMVDAAIVMIENVHKHIEKTPLTNENRWTIMTQAATEVGPPLFFSLLIITLSFLPVFSLEAQEGRLFAPLAYTKTFAMAAAAGLSITLVPVLMGYFIRGHITPEEKNPVNRLLITLYRPVIGLVLSIPRILVLLTLVLIAVGFWPLDKIGSEFMPDLDEGDLLYMPSAFPAVSIGKAQQILQQTDKLIRTVPEVKRVFGKIGRADSATDPAPLTMVETTIQLKPREEWRPGMTLDKLKKELNGLVKFPGLTNAWVMPIKNRIDMLATGIKTPVGVKVAGPDLEVIQKVGKQLEEVIQKVPGTVSVYSERVAGGRYVTVDIDRKAAARFGLNIADVQEVVRTALGGMRVTQSVEGLERYPVNVRYPREIRNSLERIRNLPIVTPAGAHIPLVEVADVRVETGPGMIKTENARLNGWTYIDIQGRDLGSYVVDAQRIVAEQLKLPPGYSISWSGQYEYMVRAKEKLTTVVPVTVVIIVLLLYLNFRNITEVLIILGTLPLALVGGIWLLYLLDYNMSVAVGVGFIALSGVSVEIGVVMLVYLNQALRQLTDRAAHQSRKLTREDVRNAVIEGALLRVRPIMMTVAAIIAGLLPIMLGGGTGSEVMRRIAAPMIGGMVSATILTLIVLPAVFLIWKQRGLPRTSNNSPNESEEV